LKAGHTYGISRRLQKLPLAGSFVEAECAAAEAVFANIVIVSCGVASPLLLVAQIFSSLPAAQT
jgi:hypothetical protein